MVKLTIRLPDDVHAALVQAATTDDRSLNWEAIAMLRTELIRRAFLPALKGGASCPDVR